MTKLLKCLLHKPEDQSLVPSTHLKELCVISMLGKPSSWGKGMNRQTPMVHRPARLASCQLQASEKPLKIKVGAPEDQNQRMTSAIPMDAYTRAHALTCSYMLDAYIYMHACMLICNKKCKEVWLKD